MDRMLPGSFDAVHSGENITYSFGLRRLVLSFLLFIRSHWHRTRFVIVLTHEMMILSRRRKGGGILVKYRCLHCMPFMLSVVSAQYVLDDSKVKPTFLFQQRMWRGYLSLIHTTIYEAMGVSSQILWLESDLEATLLHLIDGSNLIVSIALFLDLDRLFFSPIWHLMYHSWAGGVQHSGKFNLCETISRLSVLFDGGDDAARNHITFPSLLSNQYQSKGTRGIPGNFKEFLIIAGNFKEFLIL